MKKIVLFSSILIGIIALGSTELKALSPLPPSQEFTVGVSDFYEHEDFDKTKNVDSAYFNIYSIEFDESNRNYAGTLINTLPSGSEFEISSVRAVNFVGFETKFEAEQATTWNFSSPPYKYFPGSGICQTNFFEENEILIILDGEESCAISLSTPYRIMKEVPLNRYPLDDQVIIDHDTNYLHWNSVSGAPMYEVEMEYNNFDKVTNWSFTGNYYSDDSYLNSLDISGNRYHRFRVRVVDEDKNMLSEWSPFTDFELLPDNGVGATEGYDMNHRVDLEDSLNPYIAWNKYNGTLSGYTIFYTEGVHSNGASSDAEKAFTTRDRNYYYFSDAELDDFTTYTIKVVPFINTPYSQTYIYPGTQEFTITTSEVGQKFNPFLDVSDSGLESRAILNLYSRGILQGYSDGSFSGSNFVNRAEMLKILYEAEGEELEEPAYILEDRGEGGFSGSRYWENNFTDTDEFAWYWTYVKTALKDGVVQGYDDFTFRPANSINTAEFLKVFTEMYGLSESLPHGYQDVSSSDWFDKYAGVAWRYGLLPNRSNLLEPGRLMTRNEVAVAIYNYLDL